MGEGKTGAALDLRLDVSYSMSDVMPRPTELSSSSSVESAASCLFLSVLSAASSDLRPCDVQAGLVPQLARLRSVQIELCVDAELRTE